MLQSSREENMESEQKNLDGGLKTFPWTKGISRIMGEFWPLAPNYYLFYFHILYLSCVIILQVIDLYEFIDDVDKIIDIFTENLGSTIIYVRIVMLRVHNYQIGRLIEYNTVSFFKNSCEIKLFIEYFNKGRFILKGLSIFVISSEFFYYFDALLSSLFLINLINEGSTVDCILISRVFLTNEKLTVFTVKIYALHGGLESRKKLDKIIAEHSRLLKANWLLYLNIQFVMCIIGYQVLICYMVGRESKAITYILYILQMYLILIIYCVMKRSQKLRLVTRVSLEIF
ncbi:uncharacterized protein LOC141528754 [Cotesia typhae]|uniref:uncharacterized protein LOC141528754 n=1 Tax=Cotesia typhae TaxID=2053667 RepID=UPI003D682B65